jgi:hypothetical protein
MFDQYFSICFKKENFGARWPARVAAWQPVGKPRRRVVAGSPHGAAAMREVPARTVVVLAPHGAMARPARTG